MENQKQEKIGAGIITLSVIQIIIYAFGILGSLMFFIPSVQEIMGEFYAQIGLTTTTVIINLISTALVLISLILILMKKSIGVYLYFLITAASIIYTIVMTGFSITNLISSLIFPILMAYFIYKKKTLFGLGNN
ncbi:hypothetical protein FHH43_09575 [Clostridium perfringens]|nr:hypothetical protein [Clostridium perfringens]